MSQNNENGSYQIPRVKDDLPFIKTNNKNPIFNLVYYTVYSIYTKYLILYTVYWHTLWIISRYLVFACGADADRLLSA